MVRSTFLRKFARKLLLAIVSITLALFTFGTLPVITNNSVSAASAILPINMIYYGWHDTTVDNSIINAHPEFLVSCSPAGPWKSNADISKFTSAGIKYFEYLDGSYEGKYPHSIPNDIWSNLSYIDAAAAAGAYGVFLDQVSDGIYTPANYSYLQQIADRAHSLGLKVVFNTGMFAWADQLMNYCDFINSSETWTNSALTDSQSKWASRTWLLTYGIYDAATAANLTNAALAKGIKSHYATTVFGSLPNFLATYVSQITSYTAPAPAPAPPTTAGQTLVTFSSNPDGSEVWLDYVYKGVTPLNLTVSTGNHHIGFNKYGYYNNTPVQGDFLLGNTAMTVNGDLVTGQIASTGAASSTQTSNSTAVSFSSSPVGVEVWLDYVYKGVTPLKITVPAGSYHMGFYKAGYNNNQSVVVDFFPSGQPNLNIYGDMQTGYSSMW